MVRRYYGLPPLSALAVFESTARNGSVTRAAKELNVTPSAVSRQIKSLEDDLGVALFERKSSGLQLAAVAQDLFAVLAASFHNCGEAVRALKAGTGIETVTFACTDSFSNYWLMPRMIDFWAAHPRISVNHLVSDNTRDFRRADVDLFVRFGKGALSNEKAVRLFGDTVYPVCGAGFAQAHDIADSALFKQAPLLQMDWNDPEWITWEDILQVGSMSFGAFQGRRFGRYETMLMAAEANQGIAIGWDALVRPLLSSGRLVRFAKPQISMNEHYYVVWNDKKPLSEAAQILKAWIVQQARKMPADPYCA